MSEQNETKRAGRRAGLFDLRLILAVLFGIYGIIVTVMGIGFTSQADLAKAGGTNVNLWSGIPMLVVAALFALWAQLRPVRIPVGTHDTTEDPSGNDAPPAA